LALLEAPLDAGEWTGLEPAERRRRMLDAVRRLLLRESQAQPLVVVLEDLHWADAETRAVLHELVDDLPAARILLLVSYRPGYRHEWGSRAHGAEIRIDPLAPVSATAILRALLGADGSTGELEAVLVERTGGNPLFLEESVRALVETGALVGERGA